MLDRIDEICDDFENALRRHREGEEPVRIEAYLDEAEEEFRPRLLRELLEIEIEYSAAQNQDESSELPVLALQDSLKNRFPEHASHIDSVVRRVAQLRQIGDYEILEELGHGGMGIVYKARQKLLNQVVAIKVLSQTLLDDPQAVGRFRREMQLIGGLNHPNIVRALNAGESDGTHYLVMEFVDGITLQKLCDVIRKGSEEKSKSTDEFLHETEQTSPMATFEAEKQETNSKTGQTPPTLTLPRRERGVTVTADEPPRTTLQTTLQTASQTMPLAAACEAIRQAALGLQHAHQYGLVHRDIKPANLMLDRSGAVKVLDLGLGKFLAEKRVSDDEASLTMAGTTIGTIDYISPEQCENAGTADIRADLYSLGCTLFFLATGRAPYSGSRYDTTRKKLMAHIVGEVPKLGKTLTDVPPELEAILEKMLAKEPTERFQTPLEVAEALTPFAAFEELYKLIGDCALEPSGIHSPSSTSRLSDATKTLRDAEKMSLVHIAKLKSISKVLWATAIIVFAMLFGAGIGIRHYISKHFPEPHDGQPSEAGNSLTVPATASPQTIIQTDLALLPGLYGGWWFEETPWFLPSVRALLMQELELAGDLKSVLGEKPDKYLETNIPAVRDWLWQIVEKRLDKLPSKQRALVQKLHEIDNNRDEASLEALLKLIAVKEEPLANGGSTVNALSPDVLHSIANLEHRLAVMRNDKELAQKAAAHYAETQTRYRQENKPSSPLLEVLCLSDAARLEYFATGSYEKAIAKFDSVRVLRRERGNIRSPLFQAEYQAAYGTLLAESGQFQDDVFLRAIESLGRSSLGNNHPLAALLAERYAWALLDQWKLAEAENQFRKALLIRGGNQLESGDPLAAIYIWNNWHALALTLRYLDSPQQAVEEFRKTLESIDRGLQRNTGTTVSVADVSTAESRSTGLFAIKAKNREASTRERLADCTLYGGAASGQGHARLQEMAKLYGEAAELYENAGSKRVVLAKQAIAHLLVDDISTAERILCELDEQTQQLLGNQSRGDLTHQLADAMLSYKKGMGEKSGDAETAAETIAETKEQAETALRQFLEQFSLSSSPVFADGTRRENLELRIFCAEFLFHEGKKANATQTLSRDLIALDQIARLFLNKPESRPYLRRVQEIIVQNCALLYENNPDITRRPIYLRAIVRVLEWMRLRERTEGPAEEPASVLVAFFLTEEASDGFVVFYPLDVSRNGELFRLPLTRKDIKTGLKPDDPKRKLDSRLLTLIETEQNAGKRVSISWNDLPSWHLPEDALTEADWPFENLDLR